MFKNKKIAFGVAFVFILSFYLWINSFSMQKEVVPSIKSVLVGGVSLDVQIADTVEEQALGLSGRKNLENKNALLFVFDKVGKYNFWMKDMNFPIDILWIDEYMHVVYIKKNAEPESYPNMFGPASSNTKYVLETVAGFSEHNKVKVGDSVTFGY